MEEPAQRLRRLARDLCPGEPLGEKGRFASGVFAFTAIKVHPDGMGALKKRSAIRWENTGRMEHQTSYGRRI